QRLGQRSERDPAHPPALPFLHRVEDRLRTIAHKRQIHARPDSMNDRTLVEKEQIELEYVMADDQIAARIEALQHPPEGPQSSRFVEMKRARLTLAPEQPLVQDLLIPLHDDSDGKHSPGLAA